MLLLISTRLPPCHYTALPMMLLCILLHTINHVQRLTRITETAEMSMETTPYTLFIWRHIHVKDLKASKVTLLKHWKCVSESFHFESMETHDFKSARESERME